jgi:hypothetical protein
LCSDAVKRQELPRILDMHDGELEAEQEHTDEITATPEIFLVKDFRRAEIEKESFGCVFFLLVLYLFCCGCSTERVWDVLFEALLHYVVSVR